MEAIPRVPRPEDSEWEVRTTAVGDAVHVEPMNGLMGVTSWRWGSEYARSERALRRLIAKCERWCARENERDRRGRALRASAD